MPEISPLRRPVLAPALAGLVLGVAIQLQQAQLFSIDFYGSFIAVALILYASTAIKNAVFEWRAVGVFAAGLCLAFALCGLRASSLASTALDPALEGRDVVVTGVVAAMPQRNVGGARFRLEVESAVLMAEAAGQQAVVVPPLVYLGWYANPGEASVPSIVPGQRWTFAVRLKAPHGNSNPDGFDYELWLWEQGLQATGYVRAGPSSGLAPRLIAQTGQHPLERARQSVRNAIFSAIADPRSAGIVAALVVGDQAAIERADWDVFRATGVAHLMSISGLHVTLFAWLAAWVLVRLWRCSAWLCLRFPAPTAALIGGVLLATAYALFSGWGVPSQRTVIMLATVGALRWAGVRWPWPLVWMLAVAAVLAFDPFALLQAGFWLSFVAVGVLFASDRGAQPDDVALERPMRARSRNEARALAALAAVGGLLREQAVITLVLTPLTLLLFGQFSVVGLLANLVAIPWVTLVVTPLAMLGVAWSPVWVLCTWALQAMVLVLQTLGALPFATVSVATPAIWISALGGFGGLLIVLRLPWALRALGVPLLLPVLLWQAPRPAPGVFELIAADVGQGTAVLVRTAHHSLLFDAGPRFGADSDAGHRVLVPLLRALDERLDVVMLSHRDIDHTGGAPAVLAMQPQARLVSSIEADHMLQTLRPAEPCLAGQHWQWDGVDFEVLHPTPQDYASAAAGRLKSNGLSCVLRVAASVAPHGSALLTGDIEAAQEAQLLATLPPDKLKTDVLLVPHHGSKTSSTEAFIAAVDPRIALVQAGYRNRFGHPVAAVMARYRTLSNGQPVRVLDSPHCGAATWSSAEVSTVRCERAQSPRYWQHRLAG